ncbi:MAG: DUF2066 domain-containing protein [Proteobacteria bacterium]|nr:DUF2066 domain-containing protein [Pseudomonadota bacterium]
MRRFLTLFCLGLLAFAGMAHAAVDEIPEGEENPYVISPVTVKLKNPDPVKARETALNQAVEEGFTRMLRALTAQSAWNRFDEVRNHVSYNDALEKFNILEEKTGREYELTLELTFNRDLMRKALQDLGIPFSEVGAGPVLVLPLMDDSDKGLMLWQEENPWRDALYNAANTKAGLVRFILPIGDPKEMMMLTAEMAAFGAGDMINEVAHGYAADEVVVPRLRVTERMGRRVLDVEATWYGKKAIDPVVLELPYPEDMTLAAAVNMAAEKLIFSLEDAWRDIYLLTFDQPGSMMLSYKVKTLPELLQMQERITSVPIVQKVWLRSVNRTDAMFQVDYFGETSRFATLALEKGLNIFNTGEEWQVALQSDMPKAEAPAEATTLTIPQVTETPIFP